jgi:2-amino-4-hydroxy-6-hydroxymethyldihydropteridine diphosphokinase
MQKKVFVALGSNKGNSLALVQRAIEMLHIHPQIENVVSSRFYITTPVSPIPQNNFLNAVCHFNTTLHASELLGYIQQIEKQLGKEPSQVRNAPRFIDLDILLFGEEIHKDKNLTIPHPQLLKRLFVLVPLHDLTSHITLPDPHTSSRSLSVNLSEFLAHFPNIHKEIVYCLEKPCADNARLDP